MVDRIIRRKNRNFAKEAGLMRTWLRETDQSYGRDDEDYDSEEDEEGGGAKAAAAEEEEEGEGEGMEAAEEVEDTGGEHDDADDGAPEDAFSINRTDPRLGMLKTLREGVAVGGGCTRSIQL